MPNYNEMWEKYKNEVLNRVQNPGQTLATALQEGMPTEEQPLGMFGLGGIINGYKVGDKVLTKTGLRGDITSVRTIPDYNLEKWKELRDALSKQAFQGYIKGTHSFDQATEIYNYLLKKNENQLELLRKHQTGVSDLPKVLLEGETRAKTLFPSEIETLYSKPKIVKEESLKYKDPFKDTTQ